MVSTLANGLFVRRAVVPDFSPEREVSAVMAVIGAALKGHIDFGPAAPAGPNPTSHPGAAPVAPAESDLT